MYWYQYVVSIMHNALNTAQNQTTAEMKYKITNTRGTGMTDEGFRSGFK